MFFDPKSKGFFDKNVDNAFVQITDEEYAYLLDAQTSGYKIDSDSNGFPIAIEREGHLKESERFWRDSELKRSDIELFKVQDSDPKAKGTVAQWREYRKALRNLPEDPLFPSTQARPIAPDKI